MTRPDAIPSTPVPAPINRLAGGAAVGGGQPWNPRRRADFAAIRAAGLTWQRSDFDWRFIEVQRDQWDLTLYDATVKDATAAGLRTLAILHTVPGWANGNAGDHAPPDDSALMTEYCYRTVLHYLPLGVTAYEIGNEVNLPAAGRPQPSGTLYTTRFLLPCVAGVRRAATEAGIGATIVLGSLVPSDDKNNTPNAFLTAVYAAKGKGNFDAVALHPYTGADAPALSDHLTSAPDSLYRIMVANGNRRMLIWATEFGYPTAGRYSVTEGNQRDFVTPSLRSWYAHSYAGPLFWYTVRDSGMDPNEREEHFGLLRFDGSHKPAYDAVAAWFNKPAAGPTPS